MKAKYWDGRNLTLKGRRRVYERNTYLTGLSNVHCIEQMLLFWACPSIISAAQCQKARHPERVHLGPPWSRQILYLWTCRSLRRHDVRVAFARGCSTCLGLGQKVGIYSCDVPVQLARYTHLFFKYAMHTILPLSFSWRLPSRTSWDFVDTNHDSATCVCC